MIRKTLRGALFLLPVLFLLPQLDSIPFERGQEFTDFLVSHYPNALYLQRALAEWGTIPLWSPAILSGYPFAANPLSGLFYPPGWIALLFPLPFGLNLMVVLHLVWAGAGMYRLMREEGLGDAASLFGALSFESLPKLYSHLGAGHITLVYAVAWTPWLLYFERRFGGSRDARWLVSGAVLGIIALADVRWAVYSGLFWFAYSAWMRWKMIAGSYDSRFQWPEKIAGKGIFALLVAAPLLLPMAEYARLSTRSLLTAADSLFLSLPAANLFGLAVPTIGGAAEWVVYAGAVVLTLVVFTAVYRTTRGRAAFWLVAVLLSLLFALGSNLPGMQFVAGLPGMSMLRVPPRVIFLTGLSMCAAAAVGLDGLVKMSVGGEKDRRDRSRLVLFGVTAFMTLLALAVNVNMREPEQALARIQFGWAAVVMVFATVLVFALRSGRLPVNTAAALLLGVALADVISLNTLSLEFRSLQSELAAGERIVRTLLPVENVEPFRIYSPSYSLPQHAAAYYGFELADGVDPLQLSTYVDYMAQASGVTVEGYSVTLPPFKNGDPSNDNRAAVPDARLLGMLNVRYVVSAYPLSAQGLELINENETVYIFNNDRFLPRAWVQDDDAPIGSEVSAVASLERSPNQIDITAGGPGLLVLSEIAYPGWRVEIDGEVAKMVTVEGIFRGVLLDAGTHSVRFTFRPLTVYLGIGLCLAALIGWGIMFAWARRHRG